MIPLCVGMIREVYVGYLAPSDPLSRVKPIYLAFFVIEFYEVLGPVTRQRLAKVEIGLARRQVLCESDRGADLVAHARLIVQRLWRYGSGDDALPIAIGAKNCAVAADIFVLSLTIIERHEPAISHSQR